MPRRLPRLGGTLWDLWSRGRLVSLHGVRDFDPAAVGLAMKGRRAERLEPDRDATSVVGPADLENLLLTARAGYLTTGLYEQVTPRSRRRTQRRLRALLDHGLLRAHLQGDALHREQVYTVTAAGFERLEEKGLIERVPERLVRLPRPQHLLHGLLVRAVFVEGVVAEDAGAIEGLTVRFDDELAAEPLYQTARLVPDAVLSLTRSGRHALVGVEADRATETRATLREKFRRWRALLAAARETPLVLPTALLVVVEGDRRRATVEELAAEVLPAGQMIVTRLDAVAALLGTGWPHEAAADGSRTVPPQVAVFRPVAAAPTTTFRALR